MTHYRDSMVGCSIFLSILCLPWIIPTVDLDYHCLAPSLFEFQFPKLPCKVEPDRSERNFANAGSHKTGTKEIDLLVDVFAKDVACCERNARLFIP
jgi:hypothetical protein